EDFAAIEQRYYTIQDPPRQHSLKAGIGAQQHEAVITDGSFHVKDGDLALSKGSSGWANRHIAELFLRGGSAAEKFGKPSIGDTVALTEPRVAVPNPSTNV